MATNLSYEELLKNYSTGVDKNRDAILHAVADLAQMLDDCGYEYIRWNSLADELHVSNVDDGPYKAISFVLKLERDNVYLLSLDGYVLGPIEDVANLKKAWPNDPVAGWVSTSERIGMLKFDSVAHTVKNTCMPGNTRCWHTDTAMTGLERFVKYMPAFVKLLNEYRDKYANEKLADFFTGAEKRLRMLEQQFADEADELIGGSLPNVKLLFGEEGCIERRPVRSECIANGTMVFDTTLFVGNSSERDMYCHEPRMFNTRDAHYCKLPDFLSLRMPETNGPKSLGTFGTALFFTVKKEFNKDNPKDATYRIRYSRFAEDKDLNAFRPHASYMYFTTKSFAELFDYIDQCFEYEQAAYKLAVQQVAERKAFILGDSWFAKHKDSVHN